MLKRIALACGLLAALIAAPAAHAACPAPASIVGSNAAALQATQEAACADLDALAGNTAFSTYSGNVTTAGSGAGTGGVAVDAAPGKIFGYAIYNGNATVCYFGAFDQTQALTNLGTTVPKLAIGIPANGGANLSIPSGIAFATAITISATTARAGSTACGTGLDINVLYR